MNSETLDLIASYFHKKAQIRHFWLFVSHARGTQSPTSEIDIQIQVYKNTPYTLFDLAEIQQDLSQLTAQKTDYSWYKVNAFRNLILHECHAIKMDVI